MSVGDQEETVWVLDMLYSRDHSDIIFGVNRAWEVRFLVVNFVISNKSQLRSLHECTAPVIFVSVLSNITKVVAQSS